MNILFVTRDTITIEGNYLACISGFLNNTAFMHTGVFLEPEPIDNSLMDTLFTYNEINPIKTNICEVLQLLAS